MTADNILRLLGDIKGTGTASAQPGSPFPEWQPIVESENLPIYDEFVKPPEHGTQPAPLTLRLLARPIYKGVYDVEWVARPGTYLGRGDVVSRLYRVSDGLLDEQAAAIDAEVGRHFVSRNSKVIAGDPIVELHVPQLAFADAPMDALVSGRVMELALAVNAVVKGYMGSIGQGGAVTDSVDPVRVQLPTEHGVDRLIHEVVRALENQNLRDGDIIVISEKPFTIAQGRLFPLQLLYDHDPKTRDREARGDLLALARQHVPSLDLDDLLLSDSLPDHPSGPKASAGMRECNEIAARVADVVSADLGRRCDVVVSDTDTGLDVRETLINRITLGATPLGATAGLVLYECMRVANAAEFARGSHKGVPIVVCRPHPRRVRREGVGEYRGYKGRLNGANEALTAFA